MMSALCGLTADFRTLRLLVGGFLITLFNCSPLQSQSPNTQLELLSPIEEDSGRFGKAVLGIEDMNGDGRGEFLVGAPYDGHAGRVYLFSGSDQTLIRTFQPEDELISGRFGISLALAPDVNRDGFPDIVVGAPDDRSEVGGTVVGAAYVFNGRSGVLLYRILSPSSFPGGNFGCSVSGVPDTNGDGRGEILVGAKTEDGRYRPKNGRAYLFDGAFGDLLHTLKSPEEELSGQFGTSVCGIPDLNGNGSGDLAVGAPEEGTSEGNVYLFDGQSGQRLFTLSSPNPEPGGDFGIVLGWIHQGVKDVSVALLVGAPKEDPQGRVHLFNTANGNLLHTINFPPPPDDFHFAFFGSSVSGVPDVNGNGREDILVGAFESVDDIFWSGGAYVLDGSTTDLLGVFHSSHPATYGSFGGSAVAGVPDVNGDGLGDILIGAEGEDPEGKLEDAGRVYLFLSPFFMPDIQLDLTSIDFGEHNLNGGPCNETFITISNIGNDILVFEGERFTVTGAEPQTFKVTLDASISMVAPGGSVEMSVVFHPDSLGEKSAEIQVFTNDLDETTTRISLAGIAIIEGIEFLRPPPDAVGNGFGNAVAGVPDLTGDGRGDLIVGTSWHAALESGHVYIYDGSSGELIHTLSSPFVPTVNGGGYFSSSVSGFRDLNGDGLGDVLVGAPEDNGGGRAYVINGFDGSLLHILVSPAEEADGRFGISVSGVPDINGDGKDELVVGSLEKQPAPISNGRGRAYIFDGSSGLLLHTLISPNPNGSGNFGWSVSGVSDLSGDLKGDVIVGAWVENELSGMAYVFDGISGEPLHTLRSENEQPNGNFGNCVSGVPDLNGDGHGDIAVGAYSEDFRIDLRMVGRVYLFDGASGALLYQLESPFPTYGGVFGSSVDGTPDLNGDGVGDILVGAPGEDIVSEVWPSRPAGRTYLYDGRTGRFLFKFESPNRSFAGRFGFSVTGIEDANGDGLGEVAIGARSENGGRAYIFYSPFSSPDIEAEPTSISFENRDIDDGATQPVFIVLRNAGTEELVVQSEEIRLIGANADEFFITMIAFPVVADGQGLIDPGDQMAEIEVAFDPISVGSVSAVLSIPSDDPDEPVLEIPLSGVGTRRQSEPRTIFVKPGPVDRPDGLSWETAYDRVSLAVKGGIPGDQVWAASGTYTGSIAMMPGVSLYGGFAGTESNDEFGLRDWRKNPSVLTGMENRPIVFGEDGGSLDGFSIRGGWGPTDGALYCSSVRSFVARNCRIEDNTYYNPSSAEYVSEGGGAFIRDSTVSFQDSVISRNVSVRGAGIYAINSQLDLSNCLIVDNSAESSYERVFSWCPGPGHVPVPCPYISTSYGEGAGLYLRNTAAHLQNVTIARNLAIVGGGLVTQGDTRITIVNGIVYDNTVWNYSPSNYSPSSIISICFSLVQGGYPGEGNIDADPLFVNAANGDYRLRAHSPCIDSGSTTGPPSDLDGIARPMDHPGIGRDGPGAFDMGAYEFPKFHTDLDLNGVTGPMDLFLFTRDWMKVTGPNQD